MTLKERVQELVDQHESLRAAARAIQVDAGYLSRLANGEKSNPTKTILRKMGLAREITYTKVNSK